MDQFTKLYFSLNNVNESKNFLVAYRLVAY